MKQFQSVFMVRAFIPGQLKTEPDSHAIYLFCGKQCDRIKVLLRELDGYVLLYKRLDVVQENTVGLVTVQK